MSDPVDTLPEQQPLNAAELPPGINLRGTPPDPATFDGPLNEFIELHGTAVAYNTAAKTLADYPAPAGAAPTMQPRADTLRPPLGMPATPVLQVTGPIGAGRRINYTGGVID